MGSSRDPQAHIIAWRQVLPWADDATEGVVGQAQLQFPIAYGHFVMSGGLPCFILTGDLSIPGSGLGEVRRRRARTTGLERTGRPRPARVDRPQPGFERQAERA